MPSPNSQPVPRLRRARRLLAGAVAAACVGGAALVLAPQAASRAEPPARPAPSIAVSVVAPALIAFDRAIAATGTVAATDELIVGSDASGVRLLEVLVDVGSVVRKGQLLARADDAQLRAQLAQQEALVAQAVAELDQAIANRERAETLKDSGVFSIEAVQTRRTTEAAAWAKLELAEAQRRELQVKLAQTRVLAPAAGVISRKAATVGAVVQPGTELFRLIRDGALEWRAELPSHALARVAPGAVARITLDDGRSVEAKVRLVAPTIDSATRNGLAYVSLPPDAALRAGTHARGEILVDNTQALAVPENAVLTRDGYPFVYVADSDDTAHLVRIETGARERGMVEVRAGLRPNARVVSTGAGFVKDGDLVHVEAGPSLAQVGDPS